MVSEQAHVAEVTDGCDERLAQGEGYLASKLVAEAAELFQSVLMDGGEEPRALMGLARCMYLRRRPHKALSHLQQLAAVAPEYPELANNMGVILFEMGLLEPAREQFERAASQAPDDPVTWLNLIDLARQAEDRPNGERYCRRLLEVDPGNLEALTYLGEGARPPF